MVLFLSGILSNVLVMQKHTHKDGNFSLFLDLIPLPTCRAIPKMIFSNLTCEFYPLNTSYIYYGVNSTNSFFCKDMRPLTRQRQTLHHLSPTEREENVSTERPIMAHLPYEKPP